MNGHTAQLLTNLKLRRVLEILDDELTRATRSSPSYEAFLQRLLKEEERDRSDRARESRIRRAKLPSRWTLETFPYKLQPGVRKRQIQQLASLDFLASARNVVFIGDTGVGKTGLATGILLEALEAGYRGLFIKAQDLFDEMYTTLADQSSRAFVNRLARIDLLVIDEMGYLNLRPEQTNIFFKLMDERHREKSTIITTNLKYKRWVDFLGNKEMTRALLDRVRQECVTIEIEGPSLRGDRIEFDDDKPQNDE
jgi:DNA replication protein DnaC